MSRLRRIEDRDRVFFVTTNVAPHANPLSSSERDLLLEQIARQRNGGEFLLFAYTIMPTHLHLLVSPAGCGLAAIMREFKSCTGQHLARSRRARQPVWQARYFDFVLRRVADFWDKLEYIHNNPAEAGLVQRPEDWTWSSARHYAGFGATPIPIDSADLPGDRAAWLYPAPWRRP
jgi:putative transposase